MPTREQLKAERAKIQKRMRDRYRKFLAAQKADAVAVKGIDAELRSVPSVTEIPTEPLVLDLLVTYESREPIPVYIEIEKPAVSWMACPQSLPRPTPQIAEQEAKQREDADRARTERFQQRKTETLPVRKLM